MSKRLARWTVRTRKGKRKDYVLLLLKVNRQGAID